VEQLLDVIPFVDKVFSETLNVGVSGSSSFNDRDCHHDGLVGHNTRNCLDVLLAEACVLAEGRTGLKGVDAASQVSLCHFDKRVEYLVRLERHLFFLTNQGKPFLLRFDADRGKAELHATGSQRVDNLTDVIADDAESCGVGICFDDSSKSSLRVNGHRVSLVENHNLELGHVATIRVPRDLSLRKLLHFVTHDRNSALVTSV